MSRISPTTRVVADLLYGIGWEPSGDAQTERLDKVVGDGALVNALFSSESELREMLDTESRREGL